MTEHLDEAWPAARSEPAAEPPVRDSGPAEGGNQREAGVEVPPTDAATPDPELPAEEDELPRLRQHAAGELDIPAGYGVVKGRADGGRRAVAVAISRFNGGVTNRLLQSALDELERAGVAREAVTVLPVPGAFELPLAAMALAKSRRFSCVVALGAVIRGDTPHFEYVAGEAASGLQLAALETGIPVAFGVLTCDTLEQAEERVDKGAEAVRSALEMADVFAQLRAASG